VNSCTHDTFPFFSAIGVGRGRAVAMCTGIECLLTHYQSTLL
jgi:hypothetical protein